MCATATYAVAMTEPRAETPHGSLWSGYGGSMAMAGRQTPPPPAPSHHQQHQDSAPAPASPFQRRQSRQDSHANATASGMEYPAYYHHPGRPSEEFDRFPHPSLMSIPGIDSLKRGYAEMEQRESPPKDQHRHHAAHVYEQSARYGEMVQQLSDAELGKQAGPDQNRLLALRRAAVHHTIVDSRGRLQAMEIEAQLHGMFFLSEYPTGAGYGGDGAGEPELTCYRRNLFQISGNIAFLHSTLSAVTETGQPSQIKKMELTISAVESTDGQQVRLIVIPWKTLPANEPEQCLGQDQEPPPLPLILFQDSMEGSAEHSAGDEYAVHPIGWRRLQFRIATANNGRRKELQQHFVVHLKLWAMLANGSRILLQELATAPIVVRGRSPRNFSARKEILLLGSSAGSRGQTLVENSHGMLTHPYILNKPPWESRPKVSSLEVPRTAFFGGKAMPQSPMGTRADSYATTWSQPPTTTTAADAYPKMAFTELVQPAPMSSMPLSLLAGTAEPGTDTHSPLMRNQYVSVPPATLASSSALAVSLSIPRYVDSNPRPTKSPRHASQASVHSDASGEFRYGLPPSQPPSATYPSSGPDTAVSSHTVALPPPTFTSSTSGDMMPSIAPSATREYYPADNNLSSHAISSSDPHAYHHHRPYLCPPPSVAVKPEPSPELGLPPHTTGGGLYPVGQYTWSGT